jgi:H+-translocating NAD(P) transhydrogenase subunit beta
MFEQVTEVVYLISAALFIMGVKKLSSPATARNGNRLAMTGMGVAAVATLVSTEALNWGLVAGAIAIGAVIGAVFAVKVQMTKMPEMVAIFNGLGGGASALVAGAEFFRSSPDIPAFAMTTIGLSVLIGVVTFSGSFIAFGKLQGFVSGSPVLFPGQHILNLLLVLSVLGLGGYLVFSPELTTVFIVLAAVSLIIGILIVIPIGGADMPVVVALLNSYSGIAVAATGFVLNYNVLIITGSLVGASGLILTNIMCKGMNRSLANVMFGGFGSGDVAVPTGGYTATGAVNEGSIEDAVTVLENAQSLIVVPGYGMAAAQAQHAVRELADLLDQKGVTVRYAIHPVAGRMPGHMNVLLAEADVPYDQLFAMEDINDDFSKTDAVLVIGANDVVNPGAKTNPGSPIYGMPVLNVEEARTVMVLKRSMNPGFAGIDNELFLKPNTMMVFGDAKSTLSKMITHLKD